MSLKRPATTEVCGELDAKLFKPSWFYKLASESEQPSDEDSESVYSVQDAETEYAKDTSDTTVDTCYSTDEYTMKVEYEVASLSERENPFGDGSLSSDIDDIIQKGEFVVLCNEDASSLADNSNSDSNMFDPEVPRADYWTCLQCKNKNNNPLFRYCEKCYRIRKNFFPQRPRRKKKRSKNSSGKPAALEKSASTASTTALSEASQDFAIAGPSSHYTDSGLGSSQESFDQESKCDTDSREVVSNSSDSLSAQPCITCMVNPKNGIFIHETVGHICCCYKCALRVWVENGKCPICNCKASKVLKAVVH